MNRRTFFASLFTSLLGLFGVRAKELGPIERSLRQRPDWLYLDAMAQIPIFEGGKQIGTKTIIEVSLPECRDDEFKKWLVDSYNGCGGQTLRLRVDKRGRTYRSHEITVIAPPEPFEVSTWPTNN